MKKEEEHAMDDFASACSCSDCNSKYLEYPADNVI